MTRFEPIPSSPRRAFVRAAVAVVLFALALAPRTAHAAADVTRMASPTNTALLARAADGAARRLVDQAPITPGSRVGLRAEGDGALDNDMLVVLLRALNGRRISCVLLPSVATTTAASATGTAAAPAEAPAAPAAPDAGGTAGALEFSALQAERAAQAARADSLARVNAAPGTTALGVPGDLPVLTWHVREARVDYVRQFRGGLLGAQRVERRAHVDLSLRLTPANSDAVAWSATADTTVGDVVLRGELAALEDRARPETRPTPPASGFGKILEPALVVVLIAGLVSLFYQNRP